MVSACGDITKISEMSYDKTENSIALLREGKYVVSKAYRLRVKVIVCPAPCPCESVPAAVGVFCITSPARTAQRRSNGKELCRKEKGVFYYEKEIF